MTSANTQKVLCQYTSNLKGQPLQIWQEDTLESLPNIIAGRESHSRGQLKMKYGQEGNALQECLQECQLHLYLPSTGLT